MDRGFLPPLGTLTYLMGTSFANTAGKVLSEAGFENHVSEGSKLLIPKLMKLTLDLKVVHDHALGWDYHTGDFRGGRSAPSFPHEFGLVREASDPPSSPGMSSGPGSSGAPAGAAHNDATTGFDELGGENFGGVDD